MLRPVDEENGESYAHSRPSDIGYRRATVNWFRIQEYTVSSVLVIHSMNSLTEEIKMKGAFSHKTRVQRMHTKETISLLMKF
jgi:hypothetical protein